MDVNRCVERGATKQDPQGKAASVRTSRSRGRPMWLAALVAVAVSMVPALADRPRPCSLPQGGGGSGAGGGRNCTPREACPPQGKASDKLFFASWTNPRACNGNPLDVRFAVDRYVGETRGDGELVWARDMIRDGLLGAKVRVTFAVSVNDDDLDPCDTDSGPPKWEVELNGYPADDNGGVGASGEFFLGAGDGDGLAPVPACTPIYCCPNYVNPPGFPTPCAISVPIDPDEDQSNQGNSGCDRPRIDPKCRVITRDFPIEAVNFPAALGSGGSGPVPAVSALTLRDRNGSAYCLRVYWATLEIWTVSPVVLVHGSSQQGAWWTTHGFAAGLGRWPWSNEVNLPGAPGQEPGQNTIAANSKALANPASGTSLAAIAKRFGVDSLHVIAHSKGGLDMRDYLVQYGENDRSGYRPPRAFPQNFAVLSLMTLGTPHDGSVLADIAQVLAKQSVGHVGGVIYNPRGLWWYYNTIGNTNKSHENLTLNYLRLFNGLGARNIERLSRLRGVDFYAVAGDADSNADGRLTTIQEVERLELDDPHLEMVYRRLGTQSGIDAVDSVYRTLSLTKEARIVQYTKVDGSKSIRLTGVPYRVGRRANDTLVTDWSAHGRDFGMKSLLKASSFESTLNHTLLGTRPYTKRATFTLDALKQAELKHGDLRR